jgi:hypothetical protein
MLSPKLKKHVNPPCQIIENETKFVKMFSIESIKHFLLSFVDSIGLLLFHFFDSN